MKYCHCCGKAIDSVCCESCSEKDCRDPCKIKFCHYCGERSENIVCCDMCAVPACEKCRQTFDDKRLNLSLTTCNECVEYADNIATGKGTM